MSFTSLSKSPSKLILTACSVFAMGAQLGCAAGDTSMDDGGGDFGFGGGMDTDGADDGAPTSDLPAEEVVPVCGDGVLDGLEQCDDGNLISGDGCDADCGSALHISWETEVAGDPGFDTARAVSAISGGGWVVAGSVIGGENPDGFAGGFLAGDFEVWFQTWGGAVGGTDIFQDLLCDTNDFCYAVGQTNAGSDNGGTNMVIVKYADDGTEVWADAPDLGDNTSDLAYSLTLADNGDVLVVGRTIRESGGKYDGFVRRYTTTGTVLWTTYFDGADGLNDAIMTIEPLANDEYLLGGYQGKTDQGYDAWLAKIDGDGNIVGTPRSFNGRFGGDDVIRDIVADDEGVMVAGYERDEEGTPHAFARRYDTELDTVWKHEFPAGSALELVSLGQGYMLAVGNQYKEDGETFTAWAAKLHVDDELVWEKTIDLDDLGKSEFFSAIYDAAHNELIAVGGVERLDDPRNVWMGRLTL